MGEKKGRDLLSVVRVGVPTSILKTNLQFDPPKGTCERESGGGSTPTKTPHPPYPTAVKNTKTIDLSHYYLNPPPLQAPVFWGEKKKKKKRRSKHLEKEGRKIKDLNVSYT